MSTNASGNPGPLGHPRGIGFGILMYIITLNFYSWYWVYKTQEEVKQHAGDGLGGVLGLVVWIIISPVSAFVIPSEIGRMYQKDGQHSPITGWTGLWLFPVGDSDHPGDRLVREGAGRAQHVLGSASFLGSSRSSGRSLTRHARGRASTRRIHASSLGYRPFRARYSSRMRWNSSVSASSWTRPYLRNGNAAQSAAENSPKR